MCKSTAEPDPVGAINLGSPLILFASSPVAVFHAASEATSAALKRPNTAPVPFAKISL